MTQEEYNETMRLLEEDINQPIATKESIELAKTILIGSGVYSEEDKLNHPYCLGEDKNIEE